MGTAAAHLQGSVRALLAAGLIAVVLGGCGGGSTTPAASGPSASMPSPSATVSRTPNESETPSATATDTESSTSAPTLTPVPLAPFQTPGATPGAAWTSITWTKLAPDSPLTSIRAVVHWLGGYVAYGGKGLWTSTDGHVWRPATSDLPAGRAVVAEVAGGLVALVFSAVDCPAVAQPCFPVSPEPVTAWTSADGSTWVDRGTATGVSDLQVVALAGSPIGAVASVAGNKSGVLFSADGVTWKAVSLPSVSPMFSCYGAGFGFGKLVLLCPAAKETSLGDIPTQPAWSTDGVAWTAGLAPKTSDRPAGMGTILVGRGGMMALGSVPGEGGSEEWWRSADGKAWQLLAGYVPFGTYTTRHAIPGGTYPNGSLAADGTRFVALGFVAADGILDGRVWTSWDARSWQRLVSHGLPGGGGFDTVVFPAGIMAGGWWGAAG